MMLYDRVYILNYLKESVNQTLFLLPFVSFDTIYLEGLK